MGWPSAKPEQYQIVEAILNRDVFVILPTGYGKSACYQCLPLLHKKMYPSKAPIIVLVVSPLRALIKDQVKLYFSFYMGELLLSFHIIVCLIIQSITALLSHEWRVSTWIGKSLMWSALLIREDSVHFQMFNNFVQLFWKAWWIV